MPAQSASGRSIPGRTRVQPFEAVEDELLVRGLPVPEGAGEQTTGAGRTEREHEGITGSYEVVGSILVGYRANEVDLGRGSSRDLVDVAQLVDGVANDP